jgi:hypothetical protein
MNKVMMENSVEIPLKMKIKLSYDLEIPLLDIHPKEKNQYVKETCRPCSFRHFHVQWSRYGFKCEMMSG